MADFACHRPGFVVQSPQLADNSCNEAVWVSRTGDCFNFGMFAAQKYNQSTPPVYA
jgi:hypothetical protein